MSAIEQTPEVAEDQETIVLSASDGAEFVVSLAAAKSSVTIKHMIEDECTDGGIRLPNINAATLAKVVEFWNKCCHGEAADEVKKWEEQFFAGLGKDALLDIVAAANYLDANELLAKSCQCVADQIKNMKVEEVRDYFGIVNDFTPEEEAKVRSENAWVYHEEFY